MLDALATDTAAVALYERRGWRRLGTAGHPVGGGATVPAHCYVAP